MTDYNKLYGTEVAALIERAKTLSLDETERLVVVWHSAGLDRAYAWLSVHRVDNGLVTAAAWDAFLAVDTHASRTAKIAVMAAAGALVVKELISEEEFELLHGPWREATVMDDSDWVTNFSMRQ